ncbi:MAG: DMT family transporter [Gammaproteobacteria bacterium]|nr:DMT family transporter [Gammaproteobacteria bacterium]
MLNESPATPVPQRPLLGIFSLVSGLFLYSIQDMVIRAFADDYSLLQIMWIRSAVSFLILLLAVLVVSGADNLRGHKMGVMITRGLMGSLAYIAYYLAIVILPLAEAVAIVFTAPIFVTVFSALLFGERVGPRRWLAVLLGFCAVVIVLGPQGHFFKLASFLAFAAAITYAAMILLTGFVKDDNSTLVISFYASIGFVSGVAIASTVLLLLPPIESTNDTLLFLLREWRWPRTIDLLILVGLGFVATLGQFALVKAYSVAPMSTVAPFEYSYVIWAVLFGYLFWDEVPGAWTWIGLSLLIACNLYILYREQQQLNVEKSCVRQ